MEYALLSAVKKHLPGISEKELIPFIKTLHKKVKEHLFEGWQYKKNVVMKIEKIVFDHIIEQYPKQSIKTKRAIHDDLMKYLMRHEQ